MKQITVLLMVFLIISITCSVEGEKFKYQYEPAKNMVISTSSKAIAGSLNLTRTNLKAVSKELSEAKIYSGKLGGDLNLKFIQIKTLQKMLSQAMLLKNCSINEDVTKLRFNEFGTFKNKLSTAQIYGTDEKSKYNRQVTLKFKNIETEVLLSQTKHIINADYQNVYPVIKLDKSLLWQR